ncbi:hypothetical protein LIER_31439 [Lithospermum erythrorhizon]|uniref:Uncharacterized protein n=1 Tax=Lithospermum erythrorhizon TaxID=34254 RepID=A0AAV3RS03_LITER
MASNFFLPPSAVTPSAFHSRALPSPKHPSHMKYEYRIKSSMEDQSYSVDIPDQSSDSSKAPQISTSRRWCLTCLCSSVTLIHPGNYTSKGEAKAAGEKERPVCRNCSGSGAIIFYALRYLKASLIYYSVISKHKKSVHRIKESQCDLTRAI